MQSRRVEGRGLVRGPASIFLVLSLFVLRGEDVKARTGGAADIAAAIPGGIVLLLPPL
jgi:hypothetical protein